MGDELHRLTEENWFDKTILIFNTKGTAEEYTEKAQRRQWKMQNGKCKMASLRSFA